MKFDCGETFEELEDKLRVERKKERARLKEWHSFFCLFPKQVASHDCRWLETIQRKGTPWLTNSDKWHWEYRAMPIKRGD